VKLRQKQKKLTTLHHSPNVSEMAGIKSTTILWLATLSTTHGTYYMYRSCNKFETHKA